LIDGRAGGLLSPLPYTLSDLKSGGCADKAKKERQNKIPSSFENIIYHQFDWKNAAAAMSARK
jgi:hypothetical protein